MFDKGWGETKGKSRFVDVTILGPLRPVLSVAELDSPASWMLQKGGFAAGLGGRRAVEYAGVERRQTNEEGVDMITNPELGKAPEDHLYQRVIGSHPFFHTMSAEHLDVMAGCAREVRFKAEQVLFKEGEPACEFYFLQTGKVALETHDHGEEPVVIQELGQGDLLGWSWLFPPYVWHFQARALEPTTAIALNGGHLLTVAETDHNFGYELMKRVVDVILQRLQATRKQLITRRTGLR